MNHPVATLFDTNQYEAEPNFDVNSYETPDGTDGSVNLAQAIASLVQHLPGDRILECSAGSGRIAQFLPAGTTCLELNPSRVARGLVRAPLCHWLQGDFLKLKLSKPVSAIVTNPPFNLAMQFIAHAKTLLEPDGMILMLLPGDYFCAKGVADQAEALGIVFHHKYMIRGRVDYLKSDVRIKGRMLHDAIFDLRFDGLSGASILRI